MPDQNGWSEWGKHVIYELERLSMNIGELRKEMSECKQCHSESQILLRERITSLEVKASIWGGVGGVITSGLIYLSKFL